ncbi:hypothetical protein P691DRAFT_770739 [Macrolepiota fuliginosa MF-IS2]|uniref:F-box domain-containing protein n=1 Tax=Macrolepiota fuliginosa MF-IS2 TaxID=1400762 RepID=A0A9P6C6S0_9AGAR|nr:hypothetical protein P691DRAFT_770739 [Macrolepiota fuliginosa MF-IS2]
MLSKQHRQPHGYLDFPYDVCEYISHFLCDDDLRKLYFVSRAWYEVSMPARYKGAALTLYWGIKRNHSPKIIPKGSSLSNQPGVYGHPSQYTPELIGCIRTLKLAFKDATHAWTPGVVKVEANRRNEIRAQMARVGSWLSNPLKPSPRRPCHRPAMDFTQLATFVQNLVWINDLTVQVVWPAKNSYQEDAGSDPHLYKSIVQPFLSATLHNPGFNLHSLTLSMPMESWAFVFTPSPRINRLEKLGILLDKAKRETNADLSISEFLLPFIQQHSESLHALNIMSPHLNPAFFFERVGHLPALRTIEARGTGTDNSRESPGSRASLRGFLLQHRETITQITWRFDGVEKQLHWRRLEQRFWFDPGYHMIHFLNLRVLELRNLPQIGLGLPRTLAQIRRVLPSYKSTLTGLYLEGYSPSLDLLYALLSTIASPILEHLEIGSRDLPREVLTRMAEQLPRLRVLHFTYRQVGRQVLISGGSFRSYHKLDLWLSPEDQVVLGVTEFRPLYTLRHWQFVHDMKTLGLPEWALEELYLKTTNREQRSWEQDALEVGKAILQSMPRIILINGLHRDSYLGCNSVKDLKRIR